MSSNSDFSSKSINLQSCLNGYAIKQELKLTRKRNILNRLFRKKHIIENKELAQEISSMVSGVTLPGAAEIDDAARVKYCITIFLNHSIFIKNEDLREALLEYIFSYDLDSNAARDKLIESVRNSASRIEKPKWWQLSKKRFYKSMQKACEEHISVLQKIDLDSTDSETSSLDSGFIIPAMGSPTASPQTPALCIRYGSELDSISDGYCEMISSPSTLSTPSTPTSH